MTDVVKLILQAGNGGHGRVSFRREKYLPKGGPDGGDGGRGGHIIIRAESGLATLDHLAGKTVFQAKSGQMGGKNNRHGADAEDLIVAVPIGTVVWLLAENQISRRHRLFSHRLNSRLPIYQLEKIGAAMPPAMDDEIDVWFANLSEEEKKDLLHKNNLANINLHTLTKEKLFEFRRHGEEIAVVRGGRGGRGNQHFANATRQTPLIAEYGEPGEKKLVVLEQKILADIGLVGFPNAGKSTLISVLTKARPKIANYPFTTLKPNLGILFYKKQEIAIADIPGLIAGASRGRGLGYDFLRHIENTRALLIVLSLSESEVFDQKLSVADQIGLLAKQYQDLQQELASYPVDLRQKKQLTLVNKIDLYPSELKKRIAEFCRQNFNDFQLISAATGEGIDGLREKIVSLI